MMKPSLKDLSNTPNCMSPQKKLSNVDRYIFYDEEDRELLNFLTIWLGKRAIYCRWGDKTTTLGRVMLRVENSSLRVDHIDRNIYNFRRSNLRIITIQQSNQNQGPKDGSSQYKGISWIERLKKWRAQIRINKKREHIGVFSDEVEAAKAYDVYALKYHKEFAVLNFPDETRKLY